MINTILIILFAVCIYCAKIGFKRKDVTITCLSFFIAGFLLGVFLFNFLLGLAELKSN